MTRPKHEEELLRKLGYDPDDPAFSVQFINNETYVTTTETTKGDPQLDELEAALKEAITALQRVLSLIT